MIKNRDKKTRDFLNENPKNIKKLRKIAKVLFRSIKKVFAYVMSCSSFLF